MNEPEYKYSIPLTKDEWGTIEYFLLSAKYVPDAPEHLIADAKILSEKIIMLEGAQEHIIIEDK